MAANMYRVGEESESEVSETEESENLSTDSTALKS